jgi:splicing factor 3B subunit 3
MAGTDKFGNMFIARLPADVSATIENDPSGAKVFILSSFTCVISFSCRPSSVDTASIEVGAGLQPASNLTNGLACALQSYWDEQKFNGASRKLDEICQYHVGDTCHSLSRVSLQPGGTECLVYTTMLGAIGAFVPFTSREDGACTHTLHILIIIWIDVETWLISHIFSSGGFACR